MARRKSYSDIVEQTRRIFDRTPSVNRANRVMDASYRYRMNIANQLIGGRGNYNTPFPRSVYMGLNNG